MLARVLAIGTAFIVIAAATPAAVSAQSDTGGIKGKTAVKSAPSHPLQTHWKPRVKNLRGKRNPNDQGPRELIPSRMPHM
jgi:hypothetical protein